MNGHNLLLEYDSTIICQSDIETQEDVEYYKEQGYEVSLTAQEFAEKVKIDPSCVYYDNCLSFDHITCIYYNNETMAACSLSKLTLLFMGCPLQDYTVDTARRIVEETEQEVARRDFSYSISCMPGKVKFEYFKRIAKLDVPGLYQLFLRTYRGDNTGFGGLDADTLDAIISSKTAEDKEETAEALEGLPDVVTIYRGGNINSLPYDQGYSWTTDINQARFFATRSAYYELNPNAVGGFGYIAEGRVKKEHIIEYSPDGECEVIVLPKHIEIIEVINLPGRNYIKEISECNTYLKYSKKLATLKFKKKSDIHGVTHELHVLILALMLSKDLPFADVERLATAAIYHDTKSSGDGEEPDHGKKARDYYRKSVSSPDPIVEFLCEYHSLPDDEGYARIERNSKLKQDKEHVTLLYKIFKDADGLDRIRLGRFDMNQLRLKESKSLVLAAFLLQEYKL